MADLVLTFFKGDWPAWRALARNYKARLIATNRINRMVKAAQDHDELMRMEMNRRAPAGG